MSRIDETVARMQNYIQDIENISLNKIKKVSEDGKIQIEAISRKTIDTINNSIEKLKTMEGKVNEDQELEDFLNRLESKCKDVTDYTKKKIDEIAPVIKENLADFKIDIEQGFDDIKKEAETTTKKVVDETDSYIEKFFENENVKNVIKLIKETKDKAVEIYNKPETQEAINKAKIKIVDLAEKGLDELKVILEKEDKKNEL